MKNIAQRGLRALPLTIIMVAALTSLACGGQMAFSGKVNVAGTPAPKPAEKKKRVEVTDDKIKINEKIHFAKADATIEADSFSLMDEIAQVFAENPQIKKVQIEGHTDSDGSDSFNKDLSTRRAKAVLDYLVSHGVDASRLTSKGFGESSPIASNDTPEGMAKNRRVEFTIIKQTAAK